MTLLIDDARDIDLAGRRGVRHWIHQPVELTGRADIDEELKLVYQVDKKLHGATRRHSGLAELVGQSGRFMEIAYSVLLVPSKRIRVSATHSSWKSVNRRAVDRYIVESLFPKIDGSAGPVIFEIASIKGSDHPSD